MKPKPHNDTDPMPLDNKHSQDIDMKKQDNWLYIIGAVALIFIVLVLSMYFIHFDRLSTDTTVWGTFGDYVGGSLNPLLSFLALIALLYTIRLQKEELETSRAELELTREELKKTADAAQKQVEHLEAEAKRADLYRIIEKLATRLEGKYKVDKVIKTHNNDSGYVSISFAIDNMDRQTLVADCQQATIDQIFSDMQGLVYYLRKYNIAYKSIASPISNFYKKEFIKLSEFVFYYLRNKPYLYSNDNGLRGTEKDLEPYQKDVLNFLMAQDIFL